MSQGAKKFWRAWDKFGVFAILIVIAVVFAILNPAIIQFDQILDVLSRSALIGVAAAGMMFAICSGGFDLSVGSILSLTTCVIAVTISKNNMPVWLAIVIALVIGCLCGVINGLLITKLKIQPFVATLATQLAFLGVALVYSDGSRVTISGGAGDAIKALSTSKIGPFQIQIFLLLLVYVIVYLIYKFTPFGVKTRAVGSNEAATRTTGIKVDKTLIIIYVITGLTAACAGVIQTSRLATGSATLGNGFELDAITAVILGGTSLAGGKGNVWGTLIGAIILTFVRSGLNMLGVGEAYQKLAIAIILLFALAISGIKLITQKEGK